MYSSDLSCPLLSLLGIGEDNSEGEGELLNKGDTGEDLESLV